MNEKFQFCDDYLFSHTSGGRLNEFLIYDWITTLLIIVYVRVLSESNYFIMLYLTFCYIALLSSTTISY